MRHVLILGTPPDIAIPPGRDWRVVSTSPWLSAQLDAAGVRHRRAEDYGGPTTWEALHGAAAGSLAGLARGSRRSPEAAWLDDWSHLLADELGVPLFWFAMARGLLRVERPRAIHAQRVAPSSGAAGAVSALTTALETLGRRLTIWPPTA